MAKVVSDDEVAAESLPRRKVLKQALTVGAALPVIVSGSAEAFEKKSKKAKDPAALRPQVGDQLVFFTGDREGELIGPADITDSEHLTIATPKDPASGALRDGSRLNRVTLARVDPAKFNDTSRAYAADDVVAFSAICTHGGCLVNLWRDGVLFCPCHFSRFDPWKSGKVVGGPSQRRLSPLPITVEDGKFVVTAGFMSRIGIKK
ncbi:MAG: Rieske (2Fe-2S) protein [Pseudomonadota bacterium]